MNNVGAAAAFHAARGPSRRGGKGSILLAPVFFTIIVGFIICASRLIHNPHRYASDPPLRIMTYAEALTPTIAGHKGKDKDGGLTRLATLPARHVPVPEADSPRLIVVGDVHGQLSALEALLSKAGFSRARGDHVVFAGDMVSKGPESGGVVDLAMSIGASGVRGNHEDRVLRAWEWEQERGKELSSEEEEEEEEEKQEVDAQRRRKGKKRKPSRKDRATAARLTTAQREWLDALPVMLRVGIIAPYGEVLVVHGGLVPGVALEDQDLRAVMNVRTLVRRKKLNNTAWSAHTFIDSEEAEEADDAAFWDDFDVDSWESCDDAEEEGHAQQQDRELVPSGGHHGRPWAKAWDELQQKRAKGRSGGSASKPGSEAPSADESSKPRTTSVIYGHDARTGLVVRDYTLGLDSGCAAGGELTAAVFEAVAVSEADGLEIGETEIEEVEGKEGGKKDKVVVKRRLVSVKCEAHDRKGGKGGKKGKHKNENKEEKELK